MNDINKIHPSYNLWEWIDKRIDYSRIRSLVLYDWMVKHKIIVLFYLLLQSNTVQNYVWYHLHHICCSVIYNDKLPRSLSTVFICFFLSHDNNNKRTLVVDDSAVCKRTVSLHYHIGNAPIFRCTRYGPVTGYPLPAPGRVELNDFPVINHEHMSDYRLIDVIRNCMHHVTFVLIEMRCQWLSARLQ